MSKTAGERLKEIEAELEEEFLRLAFDQLCEKYKDDS